MAEFLKHEDFWIFIILAILIINTFIILRSMNKESKKTDLMYDILSEIGKNNRTLIENNTKIGIYNRELIDENKKSIDANTESIKINKK